VNSDIDLICSLHQIQRVDLEADLGVTTQQFWIHLFDIGVGTVAANTVSIEHPDPKNKVLGSLMRAHPESDRHRITGVKDQCGPAAPVEKADFRDLDIARSPSSFDRLEHVHRSIGFIWTFGGGGGSLFRNGRSRRGCSLTRRPWPSWWPASALRSAQRPSGKHRRRAWDP